MTDDSEYFDLADTHDDEVRICPYCSTRIESQYGRICETCSEAMNREAETRY